MSCFIVCTSGKFMYIYLYWMLSMSYIITSNVMLQTIILIYIFDIRYFLIFQAVILSSDCLCYLYINLIRWSNWHFVLENVIYVYVDLCLVIWYKLNSSWNIIHLTYKLNSFLRFNYWFMKKSVNLY